MQSNKPAKVKKPVLIDVRVRFYADELEVIKAAAANRGLGFNLFMRLVSTGTAKRVLEKAPKEDLVGCYLDAGDVLLRGRQPSQTVLD